MVDDVDHLQVGTAMKIESQFVCVRGDESSIQLSPLWLVPRRVLSLLRASEGGRRVQSNCGGSGEEQRNCEHLKNRSVV